MYILRLFDRSDADNPVDARMLHLGQLTIGRDTGCDWVLPDPDRQISRTHCIFHADDASVSLRAIGANGVFDDQEGRFPQEQDVHLQPPCSISFGQYRLHLEHAPQMASGDGADVRTQISTPPLGVSTTVPDQWLDSPAEVSTGEGGSLLEAFCRGAGLDASMLSFDEPEEIMHRVGAVYRQMVLGVGDLMAEREAARSRFRLTLTTISGHNNNPFKWSPTQRLAVDLLREDNNGFMPGPAALKASFEDIKKHLVATFHGFQASLRTAVEAFAPQRIATAAAARGGLLKSAGARQGEEMAARHADLTRQIVDGAEGELNTAFVAAYSAAASKLGRS